MQVELVELKYADMMDFMEDLGVKRQGCGLRKRKRDLSNSRPANLFHNRTDEDVSNFMEIL